jgi:hypothetical protein
MNSLADIHYDSLPLNVTYIELISMSQFYEYIYNIKKQVTVSHLGLTFDYYTKIPRDHVRASFVKRLIRTSDIKYITNDFINDFKIGDIVTLNFKNEGEDEDEYYIKGTIINIDTTNGIVEIVNDNPLFIPRTHRMSYYTMYFINSGKFKINEINTSLIEKD